MSGSLNPRHQIDGGPHRRLYTVTGWSETMNFVSDCEASAMSQTHFSPDGAMQLPQLQHLTQNSVSIRRADSTLEPPKPLRSAQLLSAQVHEGVLERVLANTAFFIWGRPRESATMSGFRSR